MVLPYPDAFAPFDLDGLRLRNRIIKTATFEGRTPKGEVTDALIRFHRRHAAGGVALSTVAYGAISRDARTFNDQILLDEDAVAPLKRLTDAVHGQGAAASIQLAHCGGFSRADGRSRYAALGPANGLNAYGMLSGYLIAKAMTEADIARTLEDYTRAAGVAKDAGFDAVELHMGHGYLLSQFLSPKTNTRTDAYGGSVENRMRFPIAALKAVRAVVGDGFPVIVKLNLKDGMKAGLGLDDCIAIAKALEVNGASAILMTGGFVSLTPMYLFRGASPLPGMLKHEPSALRRLLLKVGGARIFTDLPFSELYFLDLAKEVRKAVDLPLILLGGVRSLANIQTAMEQGFDAVAMGRPLIHDPDLVTQYATGTGTQSGCTNCNACVGEMDGPKGVHCVLKPEFTW